MFAMSPQCRIFLKHTHKGDPRCLLARWELRLAFNSIMSMGFLFYIGYEKVLAIAASHTESPNCRQSWAFLVVLV